MKAEGKTVRVALTEPEHRLLRQAAAHRGMPVRHYAREVLLSVLEGEQAAPDREGRRLQPVPAHSDLGHYTGHG